jgi:hypothetical protein
MLNKLVASVNVFFYTIRTPRFSDVRIRSMGEPNLYQVMKMIGRALPTFHKQVLGVVQERLVTEAEVFPVAERVPAPAGDEGRQRHQVGEGAAGEDVAHGGRGQQVQAGPPHTCDNGKHHLTGHSSPHSVLLG